jgi:hypothetical protein
VLASGSHMEGVGEFGGDLQDLGQVKSRKASILRSLSTTPAGSPFRVPFSLVSGDMQCRSILGVPMRPVRIQAR